VWDIKRLYAYAEEHCPAAVAHLPKFISNDNYEDLLTAMKSTLTVVGAPVRELQVPWGVVKYPGNDGIKIYPTESDPENPEASVFRFRILAYKRYMKELHAFVDALMFELHHNNLYQGRCFNWNKGQIAYFDPFEATDPNNLVFARKLRTTLQNEVLNPIQYPEKCKGINRQLLSQKIILVGKPGTGKTELTNWVAQIALQNRTTVGYLQPGSNLDDLNKFSTFMAKNSPGIKVIEDIEAYMPDTEGMTQKQALEARSLILSIFDGAESKSVPMHTIVTTNFEEIISSAMLRSGRCDVLIRVEAPDREAFEKLVRMHIGRYLNDDIDFDLLWQEIGNMSSSFLSNGLITKGQKYALKGGDDYKLTPEDFTDMIRSLRDQFELYETNEARENDRQKDNLSEAFNDVVKGAIQDHEATSVR
jgi:ATPase family associated with various cellular activities (AAA)